MKWDRLRSRCKSNLIIFCATITPAFFGWSQSTNLDSTSSLSQRLHALCDDKTLSYQRLLREASHTVKHTCRNRTWTEVEQIMRTDGFQRISAREGQTDTEYRYQVSQNGWGADKGVPHLLYLAFEVQRFTNSASHTKPGAIGRVYAGLMVELNQPFQEFVSKNLYPKDSVIFQGLHLPQTQKAARDYPMT